MNRVLWAVAGVLATLAGIAAGHLVASLLDPASSPVLAVGSNVIDATPTPMKEWAIRQFGSNDKTVLIGSVLVVVLILSGVAGLLARRRLAYGVGLQAILVVVAGAAGVRSGGAVALVPAIATLAVGVGTLLLMARRGPGTESSSRRTFLVTAGVVAGFALVAGGAGRWISSIRSRPEDVALPAPADPAPAFPDGLEQQGITPFRTSNADFYRVDTRLDVPIVDLDSWTLTIDGDVEKELTFTFDDLAAMPLIERDITMTCVSNSVGGPYVGGARWLGVRLTDLLDMAGVGDKADQIYSTDVDGMTISTPLALATDGRDAMVAIGMNGEALPREHGFPVRMVIPGLYGFISATKWVTRMTLTTYEEKSAYWTDRDWDTDAPIKISSRIDTPRALEEISAGDTFIGGVAWAQQNGGVSKVQVRIDGGAWQDAELGPSAGNDYWRQWYFPWTAESGSYRIASRVIDGNGQTQTAARANPFPGGSSGIQEVLVTVS